MKILVLLLAGCVFSGSSVYADSKSKDSKKTKEETEKDKAEQHKAAVARAVNGHLTYLKPHFPQISASDIKRRSLEDLRRLYYEFYRAEGMSIEEATSKAATEITQETADQVGSQKNTSGNSSNKQKAKEAKSHFEYLSTYLPKLTASDLKSKSTADIRDLYYEAYRSQGMSIVEAQQRADELDLQPQAKKPSKSKEPEPEEEAVVDTNYEYLSGFLPWLKPADLRNKCDADLKRLYFDAYRAQGMSLQEASLTADRLVVVTLSADDDPYSLEPGQIASTVKTKANSRPTPKKK